MSTTPLWAKALQIPKAVLDEWLTIAPIEESFTFWCLFTGRIPIENYYSWARDNYGLAKLEAGYFNQAPNRQLWSQIHSVANWSPWMLPIEQWDGVVFIACVEPPVELQWSFPVAFVLADPNHLEALWQRLHSSNENSAEQTGTHLSDVVDKRTLSEMPIGLSKPAVAVSVVVPAPVAAPTPVTVVAKPVVAGDGPIGLNFDKVVSANKELNAFEKLGVNTSAPAASSNMPPPLTPPPPPVHVVAAPPPPPAQAPVAVAETAVPAHTAVTATIPIPMPAPTVPPAPPIHLNAGPINIAQGPDQLTAATTEDACLAWCFKQLRSRFNMGMAMIYDNNNLVGWKWDSSLSPQNSSVGVAFSGPSLFRIVGRTLRSYHGHVIDNPIHAAFFQAWGFAKPPAHVTAVPIVVAGVFHGMFVAFGNEALGVDTLAFAERVCDQTVMQMEKVNDGLLASFANAA